MSTDPQGARLRIHYRLAVPVAQAGALARAIAFEQTVELPPALVDPALAQRFAGRVEGVEAAGARAARAVISYPAQTVGTELPQLLSVLYGNISLQPGIRIEHVDWPSALLAALGGPGHGIAGLRALTGVPGRALLATALKPVGLGARELADLAYAFARGGLDIIKDDHGLADQPSAPFEQRVARCQEAVARAGALTASQPLYVPHITAPFDALMRRAEFARAAGCRAVLMVPWITGLDAMRAVRDATGLAIVAHPGLTGAYFGPRSGVCPPVLLGDVYRAAGADAVIYPNTGGRFDFSARTCVALNDHLRGPLGPLRPALPMPAGGIDAARASHWVRRYGPDTALLIGASLYSQGDPQAAAAALRAAVEHIT